MSPSRRADDRGFSASEKGPDHTLSLRFSLDPGLGLRLRIVESFGGDEAQWVAGYSVVGRRKRRGVDDGPNKFSATESALSGRHQPEALVGKPAKV
jgi:hypothetical protein